jgi:hypothetical protein
MTQTPQLRPELPFTQKLIAETRKRDALYAAWVQADKAHRLAIDDDEITIAYKAEQEAWDAYADECNDLGQCTMPGCYAASTTHAYCIHHRED